MFTYQSRCAAVASLVAIMLGCQDAAPTRPMSQAGSARTSDQGDKSDVRGTAKSDAPTEEPKPVVKKTDSNGLASAPNGVGKSDEPPSGVDSDRDVKPATRPQVYPGIDDTVQPLNKERTVFVDLIGKRVLMKAEVCMNEGLLEMLACLKATKEHEAVLSVNTKAQIMHAALVAIGAEAGSPAKFVPEYVPAKGQAINIFLSWIDADEKLQRVPAQHWVRHATRRYFMHKLEQAPKNLTIPEDSELRWDDRNNELLWFGTMSEAQREATKKLCADEPFQKAVTALFEKSQIRQMSAGWVFAGSGFNTNPETGEKYYLAESGDLICVANFATATLDLSIPSSASEGSELFEAYTERIPPRGSAVTIELIPDFNASNQSKPDETKPTETKPDQPNEELPKDKDAKPEVDGDNDSPKPASEAKPDRN